MATAYALHPAVGTVDLTVFDEIYHQYHNAVYSNIYKLVRQEAVAEDILQEVFIALWENRRKLEATKVAGWLFVTSYNKSVKYLKKKSRENAVPLSEGSPVYNTIQPEEQVSEVQHRLRISMIEDAVNHLPERKRQVFRLCRYEGKSLDEVAHIMNISPSSVSDYLKQANRFIKDYIFSNYAEASLAVAPLLVVYLLS
jgi:RNA polymerase sigma-70 factor (family 1)